MKIFQNKILKKILWLNIVAIILELLAILAKTSSLPNQVPLLYSRPWGVEQLAPKNFLFIFPVLSLVIFLFSFLLSNIFLKKGEEFLAMLMAASSLLFSVLGIITLINIVFLVS